MEHELETYSLVFPSVAFILEDVNHTQNASDRKKRIVRISKVRANISIFMLNLCTEQLNS
jgi:hypothetical protein